MRVLVVCFKPNLHEPDTLEEVYPMEVTSETFSIEDLEALVTRKSGRRIYKTAYKGVRCPRTRRVVYFDLADVNAFTMLVSGRQKHRQSIFVKDLHGKTQSMPLPIEATTHYLKRLVSELVAVPMEQIVLLNGGRELGEAHTIISNGCACESTSLSEADITASSTIEVTTRMRGGDRRFADITQSEAYTSAGGAE